MAPPSLNFSCHPSTPSLSIHPFYSPLAICVFSLSIPSSFLYIPLSCFYLLRPFTFSVIPSSSSYLHLHLSSLLYHHLHILPSSPFSSCSTSLLVYIPLHPSINSLNILPSFISPSHILLFLRHSPSPFVLTSLLHILLYTNLLLFLSSLHLPLLPLNIPPSLRPHIIYHEIVQLIITINLLIIFLIHCFVYKMSIK